MEQLTRDEKFIITGIGTSAAVTGIGTMLFYVALSEPTMLGFLTDMFIGTALFVSGIVGVMGFCSIFFNYRAIL
jgi:hypothetical protein